MQRQDDGYATRDIPDWVVIPIEVTDEVGRHHLRVTTDATRDLEPPNFVQQFTVAKDMDH